MRKASIPTFARQAGVTILEFIAFIGLAAVVLAGALGLYKTANQGASVNEVIAAANGLVTSARQAGAASGDVDWSALCFTTGTCASKLPVITGWKSTTPSIFTKNEYAIQLSGISSDSKTVQITFPNPEVAAAAAKFSVGGVASGTQTAGTSIVKWEGISN